MGESIKSLSLAFRINARKDTSPPEIYEKPMLHICRHSKCTGPEQLKELSNQKLIECCEELPTSFRVEILNLFLV